MRELIDEVCARHLSNDTLDTSADSGALSLPSETIMFTTDGFTVQSLEFLRRFHWLAYLAWNHQ